MTTRNWLDGISTGTVSLKWFLFYTYVSIEEKRECVVINNNDVIYKSCYYFHFRSDPRKLNIRYVNLTSINDDIKIDKLETADKGKFIDLSIKISVQVTNPIGVLSLGEKPIQIMRSYLDGWCRNIIKQCKLDKLDEKNIADLIKDCIVHSQFDSAFSVSNLLVSYQDINIIRHIEASEIAANQNIEILKKDFDREQQEQQAAFDFKIKATSENAAEELRQQKVRFDNDMEEYKRKYERDMEEMRLALQKFLSLAQISKEEKQRGMDALGILATASTSGSGNVSDIIKIFHGIGGVRNDISEIGFSGNPLLAEDSPQRFEPCSSCGGSINVGVRFCPSCGQEV